MFSQVPNVNDIVFDVPLDVDVVEESDVQIDGRLRKRRSIGEHAFQSLRIHLHYDKASIDK